MALKKSTLSVRHRKRGRPKGGSSDKDGASESGLNRMLERLLDVNSWLRDKAESESTIADNAGIAKSTVREAVIALLRMGCLKRTPDGLIRDTLMADRLIPLYAMRLRIELMAMRQIFMLDEIRREVIADSIDTIRRKQLATLTDRPNGSSTFMRWLSVGMEFHTAIVRAAGMEDEANFLQNLLVQVRVGSFRKSDDARAREIAVQQHETYVQLISEGPVIPGKPELVWHEFIGNHLKESFKSALKTDEKHAEQRDDSRITKMWDSIARRARCDPASGL